MSILNMKKPFEVTLYWVLLYFASKAFITGYDCLFYSLDADILKYNVIRIVSTLVFLFIFAEIVNRKIVIKYSKNIEEDKNEQ